MDILINKYLDGLTSNEEERQLREYFKDKGNDIPEEWKVFQALFAFESIKSGQSMVSGTDNISDSFDEFEKFQTIDIPKMPSGNAARVASIRRRNRHLSWVITAAACIVITLVFTFGKMSAPKNYVLIEGKKYTNPEVVKQQAFEALNEVSADDQETFSALSE
jgi:hypothetical protein